MTMTMSMTTGTRTSFPTGSSPVRLTFRQASMAGGYWAWLISLPPAVLRVKGLVRIQEIADKHFVFQRTDDALTAPVMKPLPYTSTATACAVLIGVRLDADRLRQEAHTALAELSPATR